MSKFGAIGLRPCQKTIKIIPKPSRGLASVRVKILVRSGCDRVTVLQIPDESRAGGLLWPGPRLSFKQDGSFCYPILWFLSVSFFHRRKKPHSLILWIYAAAPPPSRFNILWHIIFLCYSLASFRVFTEKINEINRKEREKEKREERERYKKIERRKKR